MRWRWVVVVAVVGCGSETRPSAPPAAPDAAVTATAAVAAPAPPDAAAAAPVQLPVSRTGAGVVPAAEAERPSAILLVSELGDLAVAPTPASWPDGALPDRGAPVALADLAAGALVVADPDGLANPVALAIGPGARLAVLHEGRLGVISFAGEPSRMGTVQELVDTIVVPAETPVKRSPVRAPRAVDDADEVRARIEAARGPGTRGPGTGGGGRAEGTFKSTGSPDRTPRPTVTFHGASGAVDGITLDAIGRVVKSRRGTITACYQMALNKVPHLSGELEIAFTIDIAGEVGEAAVVTSTLDNADLERCVVRVVRALKFPGNGTASVEHRFTFAPPGT